jgi:alanine racemase
MNSVPKATLHSDAKDGAEDRLDSDRPSRTLGDRRRRVNAAPLRQPAFAAGPGDEATDSERALRTRVLKPRRAAPDGAVRPTRAEINLEALRHNLHVAKRHAGKAQTWAVLKADAYGHGGPAVARTLERAGAPGFCVALFEEAVELRDAGIVAPILVMGGYYGGAHEEMLERRLTPVVYDLGQIEGLARAARALDGFRHDEFSSLPSGPVSVHLKIDTGMARLGVTMADLPAFADKLAAIPGVRVSGLMTHLASADAATEDETREQLGRFDEATRLLAARGIAPEVRHAANTAALLRGHALLDAVRPGIAIFGVAPIAPPGEGTEATPFGLRPVMRVRTEVVSLRKLETGAHVGYGGVWRAPRPSIIATIPIGYADGLLRPLGDSKAHSPERSEVGHVLIRGKRAPFVGAISMDMSMIDVTDLAGVHIGDEAVVLGAQEGALGKDVITVTEVAERAGAIPWEVMTSISRRVPRFYREP